MTLKELSAFVCDWSPATLGSPLGERIFAEVEKLPEKNKLVLALRRFEDLTFEEIAKILDEDVASVRRLWDDGISELHRLITEH